MKNFNCLTAARLTLLVGAGALIVGLAWPLTGAAQDKAPNPDKPKQVAKPGETGQDMADQLHELQAKIAKLEAALKQDHKGMSSGAPGTGEMGGMPMGMTGDKKMGMGMMDGPGMGGPQGKGMGGVQINVEEKEAISMMGMGSMGQDGMKGMMGMGKMQEAAALPGFPGASHVYHIGATGFFLDHPEHITLTAQQQTTLNGIKEKALLDQATAQRKIDETEQELWTLTASDQPDAAKIETKVSEIEKLRADKRMAFIRAVGEAAKVLNDEQRKSLLGMVQPKAENPAAPAGHQHGTDSTDQP